jgi:hypothetical protein
MDIKVLFGKPKTYTIGGQEFTFLPLEIGDADIVMAMQDKSKQGEAIKNLVKTTFRRSYPDIKEEDVEKISMEHFEEITRAILDVNNLGEGK